MREALGEYLLFCDSDDTVEPTWAEKLICTAERQPDSLVVCGIRHIYDATGEEELAFVQEGNYDKKQYYELIGPGMAGSVCIKAIRKSIVDSMHLSFDENVRFAEDAVFTLDYLACVSSIYAIEEPLYNYYHYGSDTRETITSNITYHQMRYIYDRRLPYIGEEYRSRYHKMFFGNLWARFTDLPNRKDINIRRRREEAHEILSDDVFQDYINGHGESLYDRNSLRMLKSKNAAGYYLLQKAARWKRWKTSKN